MQSGAAYNPERCKSQLHFMPDVEAGCKIDDLGVPLPDVEEVEELVTQAGKETVHPDPGKEVVSLHMYSATNVKPGEEVASLVALEMGRPPGKRRRVTRVRKLCTCLCTS